MLNPNIHPLKKVNTPNVVCKSLNPVIHPVKTVSGKKVNVANKAIVYSVPTRKSCKARV